MKKIICDFCKKQTDSSVEYKLPCNCPIDAKDRYGVVLFRFGYEVGDDKKDVCPECREKIAALLDLVPRVQFNGGDKTSMSIAFSNE